MSAGPSRAYAVGYLRDVELGEEIFEYVRRIEATFAPYGGQWVIHGATPQVLEGDWAGDLVVIGFPSLTLARDWYDSSEYRAILDLRTAHANSMVALFQGVSPDYQAEATLRLLSEREAIPTHCHPGSRVLVNTMEKHVGTRGASEVRPRKVTAPRRESGPK